MVLMSKEKLQLEKKRKKKKKAEEGEEAVLQTLVRRFLFSKPLRDPQAEALVETGEVLSWLQSRRLLSLIPVFKNTQESCIKGLCADLVLLSY